MPSVSTRPSGIAAVADLLVLRDERADTQVELSPARGALLTSFTVRGRELFYLDRETLADPDKNVRGGNPVLFPSPGRLRDDSFTRDGRRGTLKQHGFARNLPFRCIERSEHDGAHVTLRLEDDEQTRARYPWPFVFDLGFSLRGTALRIDLSIHNPGEHPLPFAVGFHPYFAVSDKRHTKIESAATQVFDNVMKSVRPLGSWDLTVSELDVYLLDHGRSDSALVLPDGARIVLTGSPEFTRWVVWTVAGKDYVCLEPWSAPFDALNSGEGLLYVAPGGVHRGHLEIALRDPAG